MQWLKLFKRAYSSNFVTQIRRTVHYEKVRHQTLRTMNINSDNFKRLFTPELTVLRNLFDKYNYEIRIAGGAVRDLLLGNDCSDIDFATVATPDQMKQMFEKENIRMLNKRGESHGTITARINERQNYEITTLRIDILTDGRRAKVEFTNDWHLDANRRDLTINAMFLDLDGTVYDYFHGIEDLDKRIIRFVGDPVRRIQEDYLRILRYFRFYGRIADHPNGHRAPELEAIRSNVHGLSNVSGERLALEFRKIVCGNHADSLIRYMHELKVTPYLGLPAELQLSEFENVYKRSRGLDPQPITLITSLLSDISQFESMQKRLKLSNEEKNISCFILSHRNDDNKSDLYFQDIHANSVLGQTKDRLLIGELLKYLGLSSRLTDLDDWTPTSFNVTGVDLFNANVPKGAIFGLTLKELKTLWIKSEYKLSREELIAQIPDVLKRLL